MVIWTKQVDAQGRLLIGGGSREHGRDETQFKLASKKSKIVRLSPWGLEGHLGKYHTLREMKDKFSQNDEVYFDRSVRVVVQECDHENDADRLIKVCQM